MTPAKRHGIPKDVPYLIPIWFKLEDTSFTLFPFSNGGINIDGLAPEAHKRVLKFNELIEKRSKLLKTVNIESSVFEEVDRQLYFLELMIREQSKIKNQKE